KTVLALGNFCDTWPRCTQSNAA
ncbi:MAG: hypothetical protein K0S54_2977, partial [Alphaproteobacteria bacterium]|nr:hypothetical protein [Alphaproteobacteria bacterium]